MRAVTWVLALLPSVYAMVAYSIGQGRWELLFVAIVIAAFGLGPRITRDFVVLIYPGILVGFGYEAVRYLKPLFVTPDRVLGCKLRDWELTLFGAAPDTTLADVFAKHHAAVFDVFFALPYGLQAYGIIVYSIYLYFADRERLRWFLWALAIAHVFAFTAWLAIPAAPPWYLRSYGCAIDTTVAPYPAALLRVDELFGMNYFAGFYSRGPTAFGAVPSMHCAIPMIGLLTAWRAATWRTLPVHISYVLATIVASVYLDHHWLIDGLAGWLVAAVSVALARVVLRRWGGWSRPAAAGCPQ